MQRNRHGSGPELLGPGSYALRGRVAVPLSLFHKVLSVDPTYSPHLQLNHNKQALRGYVFSLIVKVVLLLSRFKRRLSNSLILPGLSLANEPM